jgi:CheY-like chemotaxis protein
MALSAGPGQGAEFIVRLPLDQKLEAPQLEAGAVLTPVNHALRVLVVDDNTDAADTLTMVLDQMGLNVRTVYDGPTALRMCESFEPHLVLLDIGMPQMSGYDVARAIRSLKLCANATIAAVTGWGQPGDKERAREAGFDAHFTKPISEQALHQLLTDTSDRHAAQSPPPPRPADLPPR